MAGEINRKFLFDQIRLTLFDGRLSTGQVSGITHMLDEWDKEHAAKDDRWLAYALGTVHHETGRSMTPIDEAGGPRYFFEMYDPQGSRPQVARRLGNTTAGDGVRYHGRGLVQLTGRGNYQIWEGKLVRPLVENPDLALDPNIASTILFVGMGEGSFTGRKFSDFFSGSNADWRNARRIINGVDKADLVASYALKYYSAISYTV